MESSLVLQNRWEFLTQMVGEEEENCRSVVVEEEEHLKSTAIVEQEEEEGMWTVVERRRKPKPKLKPKPKPKPGLMGYLSRDIINIIFIKLGAIEILRSAQYVCSLWRNLSKQPCLYRSLDFRHQWNLADFDMSNEEKLEKQKLVRLAARRSCGQIAEFSIDGFLDKKLLQFIIDHISTDSLKCLGIVCFHKDFEKELIDIIRNVPMLEELDLSFSYSVSTTVFQEIGRSCPHLKSFRFDNHYGARYNWCGNHAEEIARNMPNLRRLHLFGNLPVFGVSMKDELQWILHGCPNLEYLDLRHCTRVDANEVLETECVERIKNVRLPGDSTDDYDYHAYLERYKQCGCGGWHPSTAYDVLLMRLCNDDYNYDDDDDDDHDDDLENFICLLPSKAATCYI